VEDFKTIYQEAKVKPRVLQNRFYQKSNFDSELRRLCDELDVQYQSFWTLSANRVALASDEWKAMAHAKKLTPQTLMYAYMMTLGHTPLSGTKDVNHMDEDVEVIMRLQRGEEVLSTAEMETLSSLLGVQ
jgi:diketogulonate reductase-like aldo/keto reductase